MLTVIMIHQKQISNHNIKTHKDFNKLLNLEIHLDIDFNIYFSMQQKHSQILGLDSLLRTPKISLKVCWKQ